MAEHIVDLSEPERTREQQVAAFYAEHAAVLQRTVARRAHAPEQTIEDACQSAWATLLRRPDVALEIPAGAYLPGDREPGILPEPPADTTDPADQVTAREQHDQRVQDLARLKPREREALYRCG